MLNHYFKILKCGDLFVRLLGREWDVWDAGTDAFDARSNRRCTVSRVNELESREATFAGLGSETFCL